MQPVQTCHQRIFKLFKVKAFGGGQGIPLTLGANTGYYPKREHFA
jgi:hypothetical protein